MMGNQYSDIVTNIIFDIINNYEDISIKIFDGLEKETCLLVYTFILKYKDLLHLSQDKINIIREIILKKYDNVSCYRINPSLKDLFEDNVYQLNANNQLYIVPLWHNEIYFEDDICGNEIIVLCSPDLPSNIEIDERNNIVINYESKFEELYDLLLNTKDGNSCIKIELYKNKMIEIELSRLALIKNQQIILLGEGISPIKEDIYDVKEKTKIIVNISFT